MPSTFPRHRRFLPANFWLRLAPGILLLSVLGTTGPAVAGVFNVAPTRLELPSGQRSGTVEVTSGQAKPVLLRATLQRLTQVNGAEVFSPVEGFAVVPPVFRLEGNGRQILRVGFLGRPQPLDTEEAYRLTLAEIPNGVPDPDPESATREVRVQINTTLTINMPVYVMPRHSVETLRANLRTDTDGAQRVVLDNDGSVHQRLEQAELVGGDGRSVSLGPTIFLLPGATRSLTVSREAAALPPPYRLRFQRDQNGREIDVAAP